MLHLNQIGIEVLTEKLKSTNLEPYWDNYNFNLWRKDSSGYSSIKGLFRKNSWGIVEKFSITDQGTWVFPKKYVKYFK